MHSSSPSIKKAPVTFVDSAIRQSPSAQKAPSVPRVKENRDSASKRTGPPWSDNEHLVNEFKCEEYGVNDYTYDKEWYCDGYKDFDEDFDGDFDTLYEDFDTRNNGF
jgi:hypothetical protein